MSGHEGHECAHPSREVILHGARKDIDKYGWHCVAVGENHGSWFAYTAGLSETYDSPELIMAGLNPDIAHSLLASVAAALSGNALTEGQRMDGVIDGYPVLFGTVTPSQARALCQVTAVIYGTEVSFLQVLWPDVNGVFPGEPGCRPRVAELQDLDSDLYRSPGDDEMEAGS